MAPRDKEYVKKISENVTTEVKKDIHEQVEAEIAEKAKAGTLGSLSTNLPDWVQKMRFSGDFRMRYEPDYFPPGNGSVLDPNNPTQLLNTTNDRQREELRFRLKIEADVNDEVMAGVRIATGNNTNPVSSNVTFGDYYVKEGFLLDQAYLRFRPLPDFTIWSGRIPNPWFYTDLIWSNDLNFEGVAVNYRKDVKGDLTAFVTGGAFPLQEIELSQHDKWLFGGQRH